LWEGVIWCSQVFSVWLVCSCYLWKLQWIQWGFWTDSHLQPLYKEESNQHWARRCKIWSGTTSSKNGFSLQLKTSSSWYWDKRCGQGAWPSSRTSSPQKCPSSRRWCQLSGLYLLGTKEGLLERLYARNEFTTADNFIKAYDVPSSSLSLRSASIITSGSKQGFVSCHCKRYCIDKKCKCHLKNMKCNSRCHSNSSCKNKWALPLLFIRPTLHVFFTNKLLNL